MPLLQSRGKTKGHFLMHSLVSCDFVFSPFENYHHQVQEVVRIKHAFVFGSWFNPLVEPLQERPLKCDAQVWSLEHGIPLCLQGFWVSVNAPCIQLKRPNGETLHGKSRDLPISFLFVACCVTDAPLSPIHHHSPTWSAYYILYSNEKWNNSFSLFWLELGFGSCLSPSHTHLFYFIYIYFLNPQKYNVVLLALLASLFFCFFFGIYTDIAEAQTMIKTALQNGTNKYIQLSYVHF